MNKVEMNSTIVKVQFVQLSENENGTITKSQPMTKFVKGHRKLKLYRLTLTDNVSDVKSYKSVTMGNKLVKLMNERKSDYVSQGIELISCELVTLRYETQSVFHIKDDISGNPKVEKTHIFKDCVTSETTFTVNVSDNQYFTDMETAHEFLVEEIDDRISDLMNQVSVLQGVKDNILSSDDDESDVESPDNELVTDEEESDVSVDDLSPDNELVTDEENSEDDDNLPF